jgi:hypothetical protein
MPPFRTAAGGSFGANRDGEDEVTAARLFAVMWDALTEVLGTAAVAAIVRRAVRRTAPECPELRELVISREDLEYRYTLPPSWSHLATSRPRALHLLVAEIGRLLAELTGTVVIQRLEEILELQAGGLVWRPKDAN